MADPLLYNALDAYLYSDTQLAAATSQAATHESIRAAGVPAIQCCICCACLCQAVLTACSTSDGPGGVQEIIDHILLVGTVMIVFQITWVVLVGLHNVSSGQTVKGNVTLVGVSVVNGQFQLM